MKYIDADKLKAEIERLKAETPIGICEYDKGEENGRMEVLTSLQSTIASLQQEQPKQKKNCNDCPHCVDRKDQYGWHFKGCFGGPYKGKFIAEIDECPLKQEQPEVDLEKVARNAYKSWMGGTMDDFRRAMFNLGKVINARQEDK